MVATAENGSQTAMVPASQPTNQRLVVHDTSRNAYLLDTARFDQSQRIAMAMATASLTPRHLLGASVTQSQANCLRVVNQALRWDLDPFAIMDETYVVHGKLGYQGKLIAAVINSRAGLKGRLSYTFSGTRGKDDFTVTVSGQFVDEAEPRTITLSVGQAKTANDMWVKDPEQKLCYSGATKWARRYCPEVVLGVASEDDLDRIAESAAAPSDGDIDALAKRLLGTENGADEKAAVAKPDEKPKGRKKKEAPTPPPAEVAGVPVMATEAQLDEINMLMERIRPTKEYMDLWRKNNGVGDNLTQADAAKLIEMLSGLETAE